MCMNGMSDKIQERGKRIELGREFKELGKRIQLTVQANSRN